MKDWNTEIRKTRQKLGKGCKKIANFTKVILGAKEKIQFILNYTYFYTFYNFQFFTRSFRFFRSSFSSSFSGRSHSFSRRVIDTRKKMVKRVFGFDCFMHQYFPRIDSEMTFIKIVHMKKFLHDVFVLPIRVSNFLVHFSLTPLFFHIIPLSSLSEESRQFFFFFLHYRRVYKYIFHSYSTEASGI